MRQDITSKIRSRVDRFLAECDEYDEYLDGHIAWLPRPTFDNVLPGPFTTIWAAVLGPGDRLWLLVSDEWASYPDDPYDLVPFGSLPFSVQKMLVKEWSE